MEASSSYGTTHDAEDASSACATLREVEDAPRRGPARRVGAVAALLVLAATIAGAQRWGGARGGGALARLDLKPGTSASGIAKPGAATAKQKTASTVASHTDGASSAASSSSSTSCGAISKMGECQTSTACEWRSSDSTCLTKATKGAAAGKGVGAKGGASATASRAGAATRSDDGDDGAASAADSGNSGAASSESKDSGSGDSADALAPSDAGAMTIYEEDDDKAPKLATASNGPLGDDDDVAAATSAATSRVNTTGFDPDRLTGAGANGAPPSDPNGLGFETSNAYTKRGDAPAGSGYHWMSDYYAGGIVEPHVETDLIATGAMDFDPVDGTAMEYLWTVVTNVSVITEGGVHAMWVIGENAETMKYVGQQATHTFTKVGDAARVTLEELAANGFDMGGSTRRTAAAIVICKYVRRELRRLTDADRTAFFDTLAVLYTTHTTAGQRAYGSKYMAAHDFVELHNTLSGQDDCDHLHGGLGFLTQHAAMTRRFEMSMQAVRPDIAMPYWDYSIDAARVAIALKRDSTVDPLHVWYASEVFDDDWFGPSSPGSRAIDTGRFAYLSVRKHDTKAENASVLPGFPLVTNAFGLTRSPWNMNRIPYVTRHNQSYGFPLDYTILPGCADMYNQMLQPLWSQFGQSIQYSPHGSLHIAIGGTWGADYANFLTKNSEFSYRYSKAQPLGTITMARTWRSGWLSCPSSCSFDTPTDDCKCTCAHVHEYINMNRSAEIIGNMYPSLAAAHHFTYTDEGKDISDILLRLVCNDYHSMTPEVGDFMESASPADPLFWPTHPTLDRLWHWRSIQGFSDLSWGEPSDCWGHNEEDVTVWKKGFDASTWDGLPDDHPLDAMLLGTMGLASGESTISTENGYFSNAELYTKFDANNRELAYVYDTFEWEHCTKEGYPSDLVFAPSTPGDVDGDDKPMGIAGAPTDDGEAITVQKSGAATDGQAV